MCLLPTLPMCGDLVGTGRRMGCCQNESPPFNSNWQRIELVE